MDAYYKKMVRNLEIFEGIKCMTKTKGILSLYFKSYSFEIIINLKVFRNYRNKEE